MKYFRISILSLFLLSCSADNENETEIQKPIDWEKELFGVGLYGTHPDSLDQVWYSFPINKNAVDPIERHPLSQYKTNYRIYGDTIKLHNRLFYKYLRINNRREKEASVLIERDAVMDDSSIFVLSFIDSAYYKLRKINGFRLLPEAVFLSLSSTKIDPLFEHLEIRTGIANAPTDIKLFVFPDTAFHVMHCYFCDTLPNNSTAELKANEIEYIHSFINTLIKMRNNGRSSGAVCTLGYDYDMKLVYDSLVYEYDNLTIFSVVPDILHKYLSNTIDISRYSPLKVDVYDYRFLNVRERTLRYRDYDRGNDLVDTATIQEIPSTIEFKLPEPKEENPVEVPPIELPDSL